MYNQIRFDYHFIGQGSIVNINEEKEQFFINKGSTTFDMNNTSVSINEEEVVHKENESNKFLTGMKT